MKFIDTYLHVFINILYFFGNMKTTGALNELHVLRYLIIITSINSSGYEQSVGGPVNLDE